jgi:DTW domain-containing protein YfiP
MQTHTRFVFLMHPKEFKEEKAGTGRLTHLSLANSEIRMGISFDKDEAVQAMIADPFNYPVLLYPGEDALNLSEGALRKEDIGGRRLVVFLPDGTRSCAREMLQLSPSLQRLPRIMFAPSFRSRWVIKQEPQEGLLATLEATHELLCALESSGLDCYSHPTQLLDLFKRMQEYQVRCASDPNRTGYRHRAYSAPAERKAASGQSGRRRAGYMKKPL